MRTPITSWHIAISSSLLHHASLGIHAPSSSCSCSSVGRALHPPGCIRCECMVLRSSSCPIFMHRRSSANALASCRLAAITSRTCDRSLLLSRSCRYPSPSSLRPVTCSTSNASSTLREPSALMLLLILSPRSLLLLLLLFFFFLLLLLLLLLLVVVVVRLPVYDSMPV